MDHFIKITNDGITPINPVTFVPELVKFDKLSELHTKSPLFDFQKNNATEIASIITNAVQKYDGFGLAACQVGLSHRVFVINYQNDLVIAYFNPVIKQVSEEQVLGDEGCLSFPGLFLKHKRPSWIIISYYDYTGKFHDNIQYTGLTARIFMHELDHLNGKTFVDSVSRIKLGAAIKQASHHGYVYTLKQLLQSSKR